MRNWFICKVSYQKMMENGFQKKVTEQYLVDSLSFTEAEARIIEEMRPFITGEFTVSAVGRARLTEVFFNEGDTYYKVKIHFITLDATSGVEKKTPAQMLVEANNIKEAIAVFEEKMKGTLADYVVEGITETKIMDVYQYEAQEGGES